MTVCLLTPPPLPNAPLTWAEFWEVRTMRHDADSLLKLFPVENVSNHWHIFFFQQTVLCWVFFSTLSTSARSFRCCCFLHSWTFWNLHLPRCHGPAALSGQLSTCSYFFILEKYRESNKSNNLSLHWKAYFCGEHVHILRHVNKIGLVYWYPKQKVPCSLGSVLESSGFVFEQTKCFSDAFILFISIYLVLLLCVAEGLFHRDFFVLIHFIAKCPGPINWLCTCSKWTRMWTKTRWVCFLRFPLVVTDVRSTSLIYLDMFSRPAILLFLKITCWLPDWNCWGSTTDVPIATIKWKCFVETGILGTTVFPTKAIFISQRKRKLQILFFFLVICVLVLFLCVVYLIIIYFVLNWFNRTGNWKWCFSAFFNAQKHTKLRPR